MLWELHALGTNYTNTISHRFEEMQSMSGESSASSPPNGASWQVVLALMPAPPTPISKTWPSINSDNKSTGQATCLDAWASRVKCPARFVSHLHEICIYIWVVYSLCFFCCLFITVTWWYVWCFEWASGNQEEVQACLVTLWLFIISCYSLYKTTLGLLCSWFENNPHFHKYSMDFHV